MGYQLYPRYDVEKQLFDTARELFTFVSRIEPWVEGAKPMPYAAVLHGTEQRLNRRKRAFQPQTDQTSLLGAYRMLTRAGIPYHSVNARQLTDNLNKLRLVIIANDQYVAPELKRALAEYVQNGGALFVMGKSGMVDECGAFSRDAAWEALLGVRIREGYPYTHGYLRLNGEVLSENVPDMPLLLAVPLVYAAPLETNPAAQLADAYAICLRADGLPLYAGFRNKKAMSPVGAPLGTGALFARECGRGMVAYAAADLFASYAGNNQWYLKNIVRNLVRRVLLKNEAFELDAPGCVEAALCERGDQLLVHLINTMRESPMYVPDEPPENILCEELIPISDIRVRLPLEKPPRSVSLATERTTETLPFAYRDGMLSVEVRRLDVYACVVIARGR